MNYRVLVVVSALFLLAGCQHKSGSGDRSEQRQNVVVSEAQSRDLSSVREVTAPVIAYKRVYITARTAGLVIELPYEEGDMVRRGDILVRLDVRKQQAQLNNARSALEEAERDYNRAKLLYESEAISQEEYERATRTLDAAKSEVDFREAEVAFGEIRSPINAVVAAKLVEIGTHISENQRIFTIEDHDLLVARPGVSELDVVHLSDGQEVKLTFDVFEEEYFTGTIRRIFPAADQLTRLFTVEVEIDQSETELPIRPGYLSRVFFTTDARSDVTAIPTEGVFMLNDQSVVYVVNDDEYVSIQEVETGVERDGWVEILLGLSPGESVVAGNPDALDDGMKVNVTGTFRRYGFRE